MGKVTEVKFNKNYTKAKVSIGGEYIGELTNESIAIHGIRVGEEIDADNLNIAMYDSQMRTAFDWLVGYLSNYPASKKRCVKKLTEKGYSIHVTDAVIAKAQDYKYIDDEQLARQLAVTYLSKGSIRQTRDKMLSMDLPSALVNKTLQELGDDIEYDSALKVASSWLRYKDIEDRAIKDKYYRYMSGKGYTFALASKAFKQIKEEDYEE